MIQVENLSLSLGGRSLFRRVSWSLREGHSAVVLGPSGQGKTTWLKLLAGLIEPDSGTVTLQSHDIGMLFQKNALFDSLTVLENLLFPLREVRGLEGRKAQELSKNLLESVGLGHALSLFPNELSGGMQKRLGIARAMVLRPRVLLYDDPTAGLDPITSRSIAELILSLQAETHSTLVTVTNDVNRAYQLGQEIYLLFEGVLIRGGTPEEVRNSLDPKLKQFVRGEIRGPLTLELGSER